MKITNSNPAMIIFLYFLILSSYAFSLPKSNKTYTIDDPDIEDLQDMVTLFKN